MKADRTKIILFRLLAAGLGLAAALLAAETALRLFPGARNALFPTEKPAEVVYQPAPFLFPAKGGGVDMHTLTLPFSLQEAFDARHNSLGFRTPEYTVSRPPGTFRIVAAGDSFTWGQGVGAKETYARRLESELAKACAGPGKIQVISLGVCGSRFVDNVLRVLIHGAALSPDLVVIQFLSNDLELSQGLGNVPALATLLPERPEGSSFPERLLRDTALGRLFYERGRKLALDGIFSRIRRAAYNPESRDHAVFLEALEALADFCARTGIPVAVVFFPDLDCRKNSDNFGGYKNLGEENLLPRQALREMRERGFFVLDLTEIYAAKAEGRYLCISEDDAHPNALAHGLAGKALADFLLKSGLVPGKISENQAGEGWEAEAALLKEAGGDWEGFHEDLSSRARFLEKRLALRPRDPWVTAQAAMAAYRAGDGSRASELFETLPGLVPEFGAPWYCLALCESDPEKRETLLLRMLREVPEQSNALWELGLLYEREGKENKACEMFERTAKAFRYPEQLAAALSAMERTCGK